MFKKLMFAAYAAVMMSFTTLAGNATWQLASGQAFRGDGQACLYQTYTDSVGADWYTVDLGDVVSAFANGTLDLSNPPRSTGYSGANGVKGPADVVDGVFAPQATTLGNMNDWYFSLVALVKVNGQDMLYVSGINEEGGEGMHTTLLEFSLGTAEYDATGGYKGKGYYRAPMPLQLNTTSLPNGMEMVAYNQTLSASGGTSPYTWSVASQMMTRRANTWSEVATLGTQQEWYHDDNAWPLELPFAFPFYGETYTWIWISSNGNIFFSNDGTSNPRTSMVNEYARDESKFSNAKMLSVCWCDSASSADHPIYTLTESDRVVVRFDAARDNGGSIIKAAAELKPDGTIILRYSTDDSGGVNVSGAVGVSAGTGTDYVYQNCASGELHGTAVDDIVFETCSVGGLPSGMALRLGTGELFGKPEVAGTYPLFVQVSDSASATATKRLSLTIDENPDQKPVIGGQTPAAEGATVAHTESIDFAVTASDPESGALTYSWKVNGVEKSTAGAAWTWATDFYDGGDYTVTCDISDGVWTVTATWKVYVTRGLSWYVNGTTGDDGNTGDTAEHPLKTISQALAKAVDGETILVAVGTYAEGFDTIDGEDYPKLRVTDGRHLTIRATGDRDATIIDGGSETSCLWLNDEQVINTNVVVEGFTLQNGKASWLTGVGAIGGGAFGGWLKNCRISACESGGYGGGAAHARLENCQVEENVAMYQGGGLYYCEADRCRVLGNRLTGSGVAGAGVAAGTTANSLIAFNEIAATCSGACNGAGAAWGAKLFNCTIYANENKSPDYPYGGGVDLKKNKGEVCNTIIYGNTCGGVPSEVSFNWDSDYETYIKNCCTNDPSFRNAAAGDFSLKPTSVCHNAGKNGYVAGALDLAGNARIQEETVDLGAYEYCPVMTITAAPTQATAGAAYSYKLTQTGGGEPVAWTIDAVDEAKNMTAEVAESSTFAVAGEKRFDGGGGQCWEIDLPFAFPYGGTTYTRAGICNYGAVTLGNGPSISPYFGYNNRITDDAILSKPVILPYLAMNWGTSGEDDCGIFIDQSVPHQMTIRWATYYNSDHYRANFSMTLYANGEIRFSYGEIEEGYHGPSAVGLSFGDGEHCLDALSSYGGSNANDILFHPLAIPEGISLDGAWLVGTPAKGGTYRFRVTATEAGEETQSKIVTMDVLSDYTIHFDANGAKTGTAPDDKALTSIEEYILPEPDMTCGCARFLGWATNATGAAVYQPGDKVKCLTAEPGATVTLYAAWENIFVLQFDGNATGVIGAHVAYTNEIGKSFTILRDTGPQTNIVDFGNKYMPCRVGWYLSNWNMSADGSGEKFLANASSAQWSQSVSSESFGANRGDVITLYAQWFESDWDFYWADPQLGGGKWIVRLKGDERAELWSVSGTVVWPESLTLPATYRGRTVSSLRASFRSMNGNPAHAIGQIVVPEGYTNLTSQAFNYLYHLESITFPSTLEVIPQYCCEYCTNLTSIVFAEGNRVVGGSAFSNCTALPAVELPRGLINLEASAFYNCTNLTAVVLSPDYVGGTSGSYQFYNCPIAKLEIPASCQGFGSQGLNRTKALRFLGDRPSWNVYNANYQFAALIEYPATNTTWNAGPIASYSSKPHKGFVGPVAAFDVTDAYFCLFGEMRHGWSPDACRIMAT